jgi:hypothetical protein
VGGHRIADKWNKGADVLNSSSLYVEVGDGGSGINMSLAASLSTEPSPSRVGLEGCISSALLIEDGDGSTDTLLGIGSDV